MSVVFPQLVSAVDAGRAVVAAGAPGVAGSADAVDLFGQAQLLRRLAAVAELDALTMVHNSCAHYDHGHASAKNMHRHVANVSSSESARLDKVRRMNERCDLIHAAWRAGDMSVEHAGVLARAFANPRVRNAFEAAQARLLGWTTKPLQAFERKVARWVELNDEDGAEPQAERAHKNRDVSLVQDHFSGQFNLRGSFGSLQGAKLRRILDGYIQAETLADWDLARDEHGDNAHADLLPRTAAQRRADALEQVFADAIHNPSRSVPIDTTHNIVWSAETLEELLARFAGAPAQPIDIDNDRCHNLDGHRLNHTTAFADFLVSKFRRVVQNTRGITIDVSANQRFFTGLARLGVQLSFDSCYWPCDIPVTSCQIDHLRPAARGGITEQTNGAPACQRHNRLKERGYTVTRLDDGTIQIITPLGDTVPC